MAAKARFAAATTWLGVGKTQPLPRVLLCKFTALERYSIAPIVSRGIRASCRLGGELPMLQSVSVALGSPATRAMQPADARP